VGLKISSLASRLDCCSNGAADPACAAGDFCEGGNEQVPLLLRLLLAQHLLLQLLALLLLLLLLLLALLLLLLLLLLLALLLLLLALLLHQHCRHTGRSNMLGCRCIKCLQCLLGHCICRCSRCRSPHSSRRHFLYHGHAATAISGQVFQGGRERQRLGRRHRADHGSEWRRLQAGLWLAVESR
jgi:hypothetical protein